MIAATAADDRSCSSAGLGRTSAARVPGEASEVQSAQGHGPSMLSAGPAAAPAGLRVAAADRPRPVRPVPAPPGVP